MSAQDRKDNIITPLLLVGAALVYGLTKSGAKLGDLAKTAVCRMVDERFDPPMKKLHDIAPPPRAAFIRRKRSNHHRRK